MRLLQQLGPWAAGAGGWVGPSKPCALGSCGRQLAARKEAWGALWWFSSSARLGLDLDFQKTSACAEAATCSSISVLG